MYGTQPALLAAASIQKYAKVDTFFFAKACVNVNV